jgi:imidazolonepropionase-like amidohydrolase
MTTRSVTPAIAGVLAIALAGMSGGAGVAVAAVPTPGAPETHPIALVGGTLHPISGDDVPGGTLVMDHGKISSLGPGASIPPDAERIDVTGKHVYPGFVDPYSVLGLAELEAVRASVDYTEVGEVTPNVKVQVAVNPESEAIPVTRSNGVLTALVAPSGALLGGTSALMMLDGWTWEQMTLKAPIGLHVKWPKLVLKTQGVTPDSAEKLRAARAKSLQKLQDAFDQARAYWTAKKAGAQKGVPSHDSDARWEAMIPVLEGKIPLIVEANEVQQIESAVAFADQQKVHLVIYGGYDAPRCAALLRRFSVPVIVSEIHRLPMHRYDAYDDPFTLPDRLRLAGVRFCIANGGGFWNERNLPYAAAQAAAYGLPRPEALRAITLYPAQILGVADRIGSLEAGKDATLIVTDGDPLEIPTHVERAFIQGRKVDLQDKQKVLWEKYQEKYRRLSTERPGSGSGRATTSSVKPAR